MKRRFYFFTVIFLTVFMMNCAPPNPVNTIENLKTAFNGESNASAKYSKFASKAMEEGLDTIAKMFTAVSKAEAIHANNHRKVLEKLGITIDGPVFEELVIGTTIENLQAAIKGEMYEIETMYPDFINTSVEEKSLDAKKSFTWALDTEKKHKDFYQKALDVLNSGGENSIAFVWYVCPVCGNTYDEPTVKEACDFCQTKKEKYFVF